MTTGIVGTVAGSATLSYSPNVNAKVLVVVAASSATNGSATLNGVTATPSVIGVYTVTCYVGAGQPLTVVCAANATAIVTSLEE